MTETAMGAMLEVVCRASRRRFQELTLTDNRRVMVSVGKGGAELRVNRAFSEAPTEIWEAIGRAMGRRTAEREAGRLRVREWLAAHPPEAPPVRQRRRRRARHLPHIHRLQAEFDRVNEHHFGSRLPRITLRISDRMTRRNGHFSTDPLEIAISERVCSSAVDGEAESTLRHEMIHLWQWVEGKKPGHQADFRRWAERLGVTARARRDVEWSCGSDGSSQG